MTAGERIYKCRKAKKLSQEYVATILGVSRQAVSKWENDLSVPDTLNYINLAKIFGVSVEYLAFGEGDGPSGEKISVLTEELVPQKEADEPEEEEKEKPVIMIFIGLLLFCIGVVVILFSIFLLESFFFFMIGVLAIVLAKKAVLD
jgi:transcriptional regulator with XRE-family HTH domain